MSDLSAQLSAFKNKIKSGPTVSVARRAVQRPVSPVKEERAKRPLSDTVAEAIKRQKMAANQFSGSHLSTQLHLAVEYIKQHEEPIPVSQLQNYLSFDISHLLLPLLREIDRVKYDPEANTVAYVSLYKIASADDLLHFLRKQMSFRGTAVKDLRDGWSGCMDAIRELEEKDLILVLRNKKENSPRLVWANLGGKLNTIDEEYKEMWARVRLPEPDLLYQALLDHSIKPTGADPLAIRKKAPAPEKKQKKARRGKITNAHMKGILKDYSQVA